MATKIVTKNSSTAGAAPTATDLVQGELAVNVADGRLYTEDNAAAIVELGVNPATEITANAGIALPDNQKATFGAGDDLQIYHDGSNSIIHETAAGSLLFRGTNLSLQSDANVNYLQAVADGAVTLYHQNGGAAAPKLATTSTGIDVTGAATISTDLNVGGAVKGNAGTRAISVGTAGSVIGGLQLWSTTAGTNYVQFGDEAGTPANHYRGYLSYNHANDSMSLGTSGSTKATIDSSGNVGIGTSPATGYRMDILGASGYDDIMRITGVGTNIGPRINLTPTGTGNSRINATANSLLLQTGGTERMRIDSSGKVGIGCTPAETLDVKSGNASTYLRLQTATDGGVYVGNANGQMLMLTGAAERMRIDSSGNVGIGTTAPTANITIDKGLGGSSHTTFTTANSYLQLGVSDYNSSGGVYAIGFGYSGGATHSPAYIGLQQTETGSYTKGDLVFRTRGTSTDVEPPERMRIDSSGNLLVGTTDADSGSGNGVKIIPANGGTNKPRVAISTAGYAGEVALSIFSTAVSAWRFYVQANGTISAVNTTITSLSDQRVKENVRDLDDGLAKVMQLQPRKFDWKEGKGKDISDDRGFIAQEFEQVFPDMISEWKDAAPEGEEAYKAINANLIPTLVKAIQEQQTLIESLTTRIAALEE